MTHILFHWCWTYSAAQRTVSLQFSVLEYLLTLVWLQGFQIMYWPYQSDTEISLGGCWATSMEMILMILSSTMGLCWETMHLTLKSTSSDSHVSKLCTECLISSDSCWSGCDYLIYTRHTKINRWQSLLYQHQWSRIVVDCNSSWKRCGFQFERESEGNKVSILKSLDPFMYNIPTCSSFCLHRI